ncbi:MAG: hypothetical protein ACYT04_46580, partial [Nostoc sp.]
MLPSLTIEISGLDCKSQDITIVAKNNLGLPNFLFIICAKTKFCYFSEILEKTITVASLIEQDCEIVMDL